MRTVVIGDPHGCADEFRALYARIAPSPGDRVVVVGDVIDKGPDPRGLIRFCIEHRIASIMGNHEEKAIRWRRHEAARRDTGRENPVRVSPARAAEWGSFSQEEWAYIESMPTSMMVSDDTIVVHAGFVPGVAVESQKVAFITKVRYVTPEGRFSSERENGIEWQSMYDGPFNVIVGHEVHSLTDVRTDVRPNGRRVHSIDTGCVYGGRMTAMVVETGEVIQVASRRAYASMR